MSASTGGGAPKIKKNASRKNKKSWRKNVDMSAVEEYLEEKRFDERIGKSISALCQGKAIDRNHFVTRLSVSLVLLRLSAVCFRQYCCQCFVSGSAPMFWTSRIRIFPSTSKNTKKNLDFCCYVTFL